MEYLRLDEGLALGLYTYVMNSIVDGGLAFIIGIFPAFKPRALWRIDESCCDVIGNAQLGSGVWGIQELLAGLHELGGERFLYRTGLKQRWIKVELVGGYSIIDAAT